MKILVHSNERDMQYKDYLSNHIGNVQAVWYELLRPEVESDMSLVQLQAIDNLINEHDRSKYSNEEWVGYLDNFYPDEEHPKDQSDIDLGFKYAWLHHQHFNPHHWQYWALLEDEGKGRVEAVDMPIEHVLCMLADWSSFRYGNKDNEGKSGESDTTRGWYEENKENQVMSSATIELIEKYIDLLP